MQTLKEELIRSRDKKGDTPSPRPAVLLKRLTRERDAVRDGRSRLSHDDGVWLTENYYLIERCAREASSEGVTGLLRVIRVTDAFARHASVLDGESVSALYEVLTRDGYITDRQLERVKTALTVSCLAELCERCGRGEELGSRIELLRRVSVFDFTPYLQGFSEAERYLRADPDATWQRMGRESRALYKRKLRRMARQAGVDYTSMCKTVSVKACERSCHIGELIDFGDFSRYVYYILQALIFFTMWGVACALVLSYGLSVLTFLICFTLSLPVFETATRLTAFLISLFKKSEILPRVEIESIDENIATLVSVTALISSADEVEGLFTRLERLYLKSRSRKKVDTGLFFGILCDLPEADKAVSDRDGEIIDLSHKWVGLLNEKYGEHFLFFTRDRVLDKCSGRYVAHERKRGALLELSRYVIGKRSAIRAYGATLPKIKYIVTLDSDTDMGIGTLSELVGTMEHPLNRPVVSEVNGVKQVTRGYGMLQPVIQPSLSASFKTPFSLLISGAGGFDTYHGPIFDLFHVIHRRTMFCGKGIFDAEVYHEVLDSAFPDGIVLSHDMLEGSRLRAGLMPDAVFVDSVPRNALSYYKRAHRWARGDVQSLVFTTRRVFNKHGVKVKNPQPLSDRWVFLQNCLNLFSPIFSFLALFLTLVAEPRLSGLTFIIALSPLWLYSAIQLVGMLWRLSFSTLFRRFFTEAVTGVSREALHLLYSLSALFYRAWINFNAISVSLWRMAVSGKGLLEWSTAGEVENAVIKKDSILYYFLSTLPSFIAGVVFAALSTNGATRLMGFAWCVFFIAAYVTSRGYKRPHPSNEQERSRIREYAERNWRFFESTVNSESNWLPCDNVSVSPNPSTAYRTSPTNIGMYLLSALASRDLGFITTCELCDRLEKALETLERLPRYRGHFYNWYDISELCVIGQEYISTVDSGNLTVSFVALAEGLAEYADEDRRAAALAENFSRLEREADFRLLYDGRRHLFSIGYSVERECLDSGYYDLYMSEMRTTDYYAVARGIVEKEHWTALSRSPVARRLTIGAASWSGTAFEYFMPHLFLPVYENSFCDEALGFAFAEQVEFSSPTRVGSVWGTSECGYFAFDRDMNYQYRAFGVPTLALSRDREKEKVASPYSSFLMLLENPSLCVKNLERLKALGAWGEWGFYEAVDFSPSRTGGGFAPVKSYMAHHVGMSIIASANFILDGIFVKRFMRDAEMGSACELLEERIPVDAVVLKGSTDKYDNPKPSAVIPSDSQTVCKNRERRSTALLAGKDIAVIAGERGVEQISTLGISALRGGEISFLPYLKRGGEVFSPLTDGRIQLIYGRGMVKYKGERAEICISPSADHPALRVRISPRGDGSPSERGIYFEPCAVTRSAYVSHPAFCDLFFEGRYEEGRIILEYHGREPLYICLASNGDYEFELFRETVFSRREAGYGSLLEFLDTSRLSCTTGTLLSPCILARCKRSSADTVFAVGWGRSVAEAVRATSQELELSSHASLSAADRYEKRLASACELSTIDRVLSERLLSSLRTPPHFRLRDRLPQHFGREALWSYGVSGDLPIVAVSGSLSDERLEAVIRLHKYHYIAGLRYDLVIICHDVGYKTIERDRVNKLLDLCRARFIEGVQGGIFVSGVDGDQLFLTASSLVLGSEEDILKADESESESVSAVKPHFNKGTLPYGFGEYGYTLDKSRYEPQILWHHIIASDTFGTLVSNRGLGHTWVYNAGLSRLGVWENDRVGGALSEKLYVLHRDEAEDVCASAVRVELEAGCAVYHSDGYTVTVSCHPTLLYKEVAVRFSERARLLYKLTPTMSDGVSRAGGVFSSKISNGMIFSAPFSDTLNKGFGYLIAVGGESKPTSLGLEADGEGEIRFILGYARSERHFDTVIKRVTEGNCEEESRAFAKRFLPPAVSTSFTPNAEYMYRYGLPLQCAVSRVLARTGPYQSGGAWGCRDQAQDMLFLIDICPERVRAHLFRIAAHQYLEGDIQHWWHGFRGTRTHCSDDYLWFVLLLAVYLEKTEDIGVFEPKVRYRTSPPLAENERERYELSSPSEVKEGLLGHAVRCLDLFVKRGVGSHGIPLTLGGDWNDGMDRIGQDGGESVWLGFFAISVFYRAFPMLERFGVDTSGYRAFCQDVYESIEKNAYFTDRYARAFLKDGGVLGVSDCESCAIDGMAVAFASICYKISGLGSPSRISASLDSAWRELWDDKNKIYKLFTPPFKKYDGRIGYVSNYPEGVRENGGQYTHGAVFAALGYLWSPCEVKKNFARAEKMLEAILTCDKDADILKTEPYVLSADIYSNPTHMGRGGWSFYTGSAGWCRYLMHKIEEERKKSE